VSPLEGDHALLLQTVLPVCSRFGLALAGGYAIKAHGLVTRPSEDVDFATAHSAPIDQIMTALADAYRQAGFGVQVLGSDARKGHLLVTFPSGADCRVDVLKEPLNHPPAMMQFGPVLSLSDAVALKVGALHDRGLPRDLIDVHGAADRFTCAELVGVGRVALDDEFRLEALRDQLDYAAMYPDEAFARYRCGLDLIVDIKAWAQAWANRLGLELAQDEPWTDEDS
jgi:predicted nucleotidyltransferase component of viral defense system